MNIFEQISCIYFERNRSEGLKNLFVWKIHTQKLNWKKYGNMTLLVDDALNSINSIRIKCTLLSFKL